jgi:hypothetical protein
MAILEKAKYTYDQDETKTEVYGKTTAEMKQKATFKDWDFDGIWKIDAKMNDGYPYFHIQK